MSKITTHIDGEKLKVLNGFILNEGEVLATDSPKFGDCEKVRVVIEPSLLRYWITECNLLEELGLNVTVWE